MKESQKDSQIQCAQVLYVQLPKNEIYKVVRTTKTY